MHKHLRNLVKGKNILNVEKKTFYLLQDLNINALSNNTVDQRFINNIQSIGAQPMITLPT